MRLRLNAIESAAMSSAPGRAVLANGLECLAKHV